MEFADLVLSAVSLSPTTVLAVAVSVWLPVTVGVQEKFTVVEAPAPSVTLCGLPPMVAARLSLRLTLKVSD